MSNPLELAPQTPPIQPLQLTHIEDEKIADQNLIKECGLKEQILIAYISRVVTHQIDAVINGEDDTLNVAHFEETVREAIHLAEAAGRNDVLQKNHTLDSASRKYLESLGIAVDVKGHSSSG